MPPNYIAPVEIKVFDADGKEIPTPPNDVPVPRPSMVFVQRPITYWRFDIGADTLVHRLLVDTNNTHKGKAVTMFLTNSADEEVYKRVISEGKREDLLL